MVDQLNPRLFTMPPLFMGFIIVSYVVVVIVSTGVGFGLSGSLGEVSRTNLWECNDSGSEASAFDNETCSGVDIAQYHTNALVYSPNVSKLHKTLLISLIFQRVGNWSSVLSTNVTADVVIKGMKGGEVKDVVVEDHNYTMHVYCENASEWCRATTLNHINALTSESYEINFSIVKYGKTVPNETRIPWMGDVIVVMECAHPSYTFVSMILGPAISTSMIVVMILYALICIRVHGLTLHSRWVMLLLGTVVLFNRPLEVLSVYAPGWFFETFEQLGISVFVVLLCGFWFTLFRSANSRVQPQKFFENTTTRQKVVKLLFYIIPIVFATAITTWQRIHDHDLYDLLSFFSYEAMSALLIVMIAFYTAVTLYALFRAEAEYDPEIMTESNHIRQMVFFTLSFIVLAITMLDYVITTLVSSFLDHLARDIFLAALLDGYVVVLLVFSLPTPKRVRYKVSTKNNVIVITETTDEGTERQSIDLSGAPHSSFSMDFHFSNSNDRLTSSDIQLNSPPLPDTLPVPRGGSPQPSSNGGDSSESETETETDTETTDISTDLTEEVALPAEVSIDEVV